MATSTEGVRVKLVFEDFIQNPSWFYVNLRKCKKISDVERRIIVKFELSCKSIQLKVSDCGLPSWECSSIVRENDCIHVLECVVNEPPASVRPESPPAKKKKKKEKRKRDSSLENDEVGNGTFDKKKSKSGQNGTSESESFCAVDKQLDTSDADETNIQTSRDSNADLMKLMKQNAIEEAEKIIAMTETNDEPQNDCAGQKKKRKRKRKNKKQDSTFVPEDNTVRNISNTAEISQSRSASYSWSRNKCNKRITFSDDNKETNIENGVDNETMNGMECQSEGQSATFHQNSFQTEQQSEDHVGEETSVNGSESPQTPLTQSKSITQTVLPSGVSVFTRQRKKPGTYFPPLSKKQQLETVATNRSFIMVNDTNDNNQYKANQENGTGDSAVTAPRSDYGHFPDLDAPPQNGDKIAYQVIELSNNFSPEVSGYKEAVVLSYNPISTVLELEITKQSPKPSEIAGDQAAYGDEKHVQVKWGSLIKPKLLS